MFGIEATQGNRRIRETGPRDAAGVRSRLRHMLHSDEVHVQAAFLAFGRVCHGLGDCEVLGRLAPERLAYQSRMLYQQVTRTGRLLCSQTHFTCLR